MAFPGKPPSGFRALQCRCGSKKPQKPLRDARGIFVAYVCSTCEPEVKAKYRPEIFSDPNYDTSEVVEG